METASAALPRRLLLTNYLIAKSLLEALLVGALALAFYLQAFNPFFRGMLDQADARHVSGWVVNSAAPQARVEVQLYIDGRFYGNRMADLSRPDVAAAGRAADELHGFTFDTPLLPAGEHEARVYALHLSGAGQRQTLQLVGKPLRFKVAAAETTDSAAAERPRETQD
ncbi:MAG TPA: hypothetical protein VF723_04860 [Pyrinomonadaceae bacterium]|jgi:hypothetical protein